MLTLISNPITAPDLSLPVVALRVERRTLAKRRWRGTADDGSEFGFTLETPLKPGDTVQETPAHRIVIVQEPEPVLEIALAALPPSAVAGIAWSLGNLHLECSADATHLRTPDEPAARQLFARIQISATEARAVFRPGHFTRHAPTLPHDLGPSHRH